MFTLGERLTKALGKYESNPPIFQDLKQSITQIKEHIKLKQFEEALRAIENLNIPDGVQNKGQKVYLEKLVRDFKDLSGAVCRERLGIRSS